MAPQLVQPMRKQETPTQWNRALQRAINEALDVLTEPTTGQTFVESSTMPGTLYRVTLDGCSCVAGKRGVVCKHRACLAAQMGVLPLDDEPEPEPAAASRFRVIAPGNRLYGEYGSEAEAISALNWLHRCYPRGGSSVKRIAA